MNTSVATASPPSGALVSIDDLPLARAIGELKEKFALALGKGQSAERFTRVALLAITNPKIANAAGASVQGRRSVYDALLRAATDGLLVDGREAALVVYSTKVKVPNENGGVAEKWIELVQFQPMVAGIRKRARNSGEISDIICQIVYEKDPCEINFTRVTKETGPPVSHTVDPKQADRGNMVGAYAFCAFKDGSFSQPEWMSKAQIDSIKARTKSKDKDGNIYGAWITDYDEMARKTVIRRGSKSWPMSSDRDGRTLEELIRADDNLTDLTIEHQPSAGALAPPRKATSAAKLLEQKAGEAPPIDQKAQATEPKKEPEKTPPAQAADNGPGEDFSDV